MSETVKAIAAEEVDKKVHASLKDVAVSDLPVGDATVRVVYSTLNYKDGLAVSGAAKIARRFPMVCGGMWD